MGYYTILAMAYIPSSEVDLLSQLLSNPTSTLYVNSADATAEQLMSLFNAEIPLLLGQALPQTSSSSSTAVPSTSANTATSVAPSSTAQTSTAQSSTISAGAGSGIGIAILLAILAVGIGVFFLFRRRRRQRERALAEAVCEDKAQLDDTSKAKLWHELSPDQQLHEATVESQRNELTAPKQISEMPTVHSIYEMNPTRWIAAGDASGAIQQTRRFEGLNEDVVVFELISFSAFPLLAA